MAAGLRMEGVAGRGGSGAVATARRMIRRAGCQSRARQLLRNHRHGRLARGTREVGRHVAGDGVIGGCPETGAGAGVQG